MNVILLQKHLPETTSFRSLKDIFDKWIEIDQMHEILHFDNMWDR